MAPVVEPAMPDRLAGAAANDPEGAGVFGDELAVDVREATLHWVRVGVGAKGRVVRDWGTRLRNPALSESESIRELLSTARTHGQTPVAVCMGSGAVEHHREDLPPLKRSSLRKVVNRRRSDWAPDPGSHCFAWHRGSGTAAPIWYSTAPRATVDDLLARWHAADARCHRLVSRHIALAQLARFASQVADGKLVIFIDLEDETGACVVADRHGWVFSREVKLRARSDGAPEAEDQALALFGGDLEPIDLDEKPESALDERLDPFEQLAAVAERARTEIRRTMQFVTSELGLGEVSEVFVGGDGGEVAALSGPLSSSLDVPVRPVSDLVERVLGTQLGPTANGIGAALGLALSAGRLDATLLPEPVKHERRIRALRRPLLAGLAAALGIAVLVAGSLLARERTLESELAAMEAHWLADAAVRAEVERVQTARSRVDALALQWDRVRPPGPLWAPLLADLGASLPDHVWIDQMRAELRSGEWRLDASVQAEAMGMGAAALGISEFARTLGASPLIRVDGLVREPAPRAAIERDAGVVRFQLEASMAPVAASAARRVAP
jgi:hypothetical protein